MLRYPKLACVLPLLTVLLLGQSPNAVGDLEAAAKQRIAAHDVPGALAAYRKLVEISPGSAAYQDELGFLLAASNQTPEAILHFGRATALDPKMAQAWYHLGAALWLAKQGGPALDALEKAAALAPRNAEYLFHLGSAYYTLQHYSDASRVLAQASVPMASNASVWKMLANSYQQQSRYAEARDAFRHAVDLDPSDVATRNGYGNALVRSGIPRQALGNFVGYLITILTMFGSR